MPAPAPAAKVKKSPQQQFEERLGAALVNRGDIKRDELDEAVANQVLVGGQLATCLWELGIERIEKLSEYSAMLLRLKQVSPKTIAETPEKVLKIFNQQFVAMHRIIPLAVKNKELSVATCEPWNLAALDEAAFHSGLRITPFYCAEVHLVRLMEQLYDIEIDGRFQLEPQLRPGRKPYVPAAANVGGSVKLASGASLPTSKMESTPTVVAKAAAAPPTKKNTHQTAKSGTDSASSKDQPAVKRATHIPRQSPIEVVRQRPAKTAEPSAPVPSSTLPITIQVQPVTPADTVLPVADVVSAPPPEEEIFELTDVVMDEADLAKLASSDDDIAAAQAAMAAKPLVVAEREWQPLTDMKEAYKLLDTAANRDELGEVLVRVALAKGKRALLFTRSGGNWRGWVGAGPGVASHTVKSLCFTSDKGTCFGLVGVTGAQFLGPLQKHPTHDRLLELLGGQKPASAGLFPVHFKGRVVFGIYLDGGDGQYIDPNIADILILAQKVPLAIERLIRERQAAAAVGAHPAG